MLLTFWFSAKRIKSENKYSYSARETAAAGMNELFVSLFIFAPFPSTILLLLVYAAIREGPSLCRLGKLHALN